MGFDFSAIDAELDALGREPAELTSLARQFAAQLGTLADTDRALEALGEAVPLAPAPPVLRLEYTSSPAERDAPLELSNDDDFDDEVDSIDRDLAAALTPMRSMDPPANVGGRAPESGEIPLPEPVRRSSAEDPVSGELSLVESEPPKSGSFELPSPSESHEPSEHSEPTDPEGHQAQPAASESHDEDPVLEVDAIDDDEEDIFASFQSAPPAHTPPGGARLKGLSDLPPGGERKPDGWPGSPRDPDAEFDAIFSDATSPSGLPTRGFSFADEESPSADELLTGLEAPPPQSARAQPESAADDDGEPFIEADDHTEILDSRTLSSITSTANSDENAFRNEEEFGSTDFEILVDEDESADSSNAAAKKTPPPPLPKSNDPNDKRPSFLGRIFGRNEKPPN